MFVPLPWDSEQFGFPAARLDRLRAESPSGVAALVASAKSQGVRHLIARVPAEDLATIHSLESNAFHLLDGILTFELDLTHPTPAPPENVRLFEPSDLDALLDIARTAYVFDRFHADSALAPHVADSIHATWVRNSCSGQAADAVIVATRIETAEPASYVTCKLDGPTGIIVLVATAQDARGQGLGRAATYGALAYFKDRGCERARVGTQIRNAAASRLYESCGFRLKGVSLTYRKLL